MDMSVNMFVTFLSLLIGLSREAFGLKILVNENFIFVPLEVNKHKSHVKELYVPCDFVLAKKRIEVLWKFFAPSINNFDYYLKLKEEKKKLLFLIDSILECTSDDFSTNGEQVPLSFLRQISHILQNCEKFENFQEFEGDNVMVTSINRVLKMRTTMPPWKKSFDRIYENGNLSTSGYGFTPVNDISEYFARYMIYILDSYNILLGKKEKSLIYKNIFNIPNLSFFHLDIRINFGNCFYFFDCNFIENVKKDYQIYQVVPWPSFLHGILLTPKIDFHHILIRENITYGIFNFLDSSEVQYENLSTYLTTAISKCLLPSFENKTSDCLYEIDFYQSFSYWISGLNFTT